MVIDSEHAMMVHGWLSGRVPAASLTWLDDQAARIQEGTNRQALSLAVGLAPRRLGKDALLLSQSEAVQAHQACPGVDTSGWTISDAGRVYLVLSIYRGDDASFAALVAEFLKTAEISELIAILRSLPVLPAAAHLIPIAAEGVRSAMLPVFEAVAHRNPFPARHFSEEQWNQMVVKALFIGSTLAPIVGLDERRNADLATILIDYAHERWAAGRSVSPELWRCVGPYAGEAGLRALERVAGTGSEEERAAAIIALSENDASLQPSVSNKN